MSKHTPGPWQFGFDGKDEEIKDAAGNTIMYNTTYYPFFKLQPMDWPLLAAAPELLEALKYARRFLRHADHDIAFVDAAIDKATKETL